MQQDTRKGSAVKKWLLVAVLGSVTALGVGTALAQVTGTNPDFFTLLQQFQSLFGTGTGTTTQPSTPTTPPTTSQPGTGEREPTIIDNQFNTTSGASLQARAPGTWIQNAQAVQSGETEFSIGGPGEPDGFIKTTIDTILLEILDSVSTFLTGLDLLTGSGLPGLPGLGGGTGGLTTIPNSTTTGAGTSTPVQ
ncbi:MAG TPA: hypothetical protein VJZ71_03485 [Phycisphaerae bacterium]|nr:hypothetical protein [Phycisphaerae bacterium]